MDEFKIMYRILRTLEKSLELEEPDMTAVEPEYLRISVPKWSRIMKMLVEDGYITGVIVAEIGNAPYPFVKLSDPTITRKGLAYLHENSMMVKAAKAARGIREIWPK